MNDQADIKLVAACQDADRRALRQVFELYKGRIFALCRRMSGNPEDAEDLTQDVFISAFRSVGAFKGDCTFGTWLYRIAVNRCSAELRKRSPVSQSFEALEELGSVPPSGIPNPEDLLVRKELAERMEVAIARLPEGLKVFFVLGTLEGLRYREIGEIMDCSEDAVKMRVHRARKRVRDVLRPYLES